MRLGIDARPLEYPRTGIGRYTKEIIDHIITLRDWSIVLFSSNKLPAMWNSTTNIEYKVPGIPTVAAFQTKAGSLTKKHGIDVFWGPRHQLPLQLSCPSVVTIHDMAWLKARNTMRISGALVDAALMPLAIKQATKVITVSNHTKAAVCAFMPSAADKATTIYEAPFSHTGETQVIDRLRMPFILSVGTQEPRKNYERLLSAFHRVSLEHPDQHLVIVGGPGWKTDLESTVTKLGLSEQVTILASANDAQLNFLYENCQFLAMPSLYEGFGLPLVEAMDHHKPILTSDNSAMREVAADAALLINPLDIESIATGLETLINSAQIRAELAKNAEVRKASFSWRDAAEKTAQTIEQAYQQRI